MKFRSVRFKISILYVAFLGGILMLYNGFLYFTLYNALYRELDYDLLKKTESIKEAINGYIKILHEDDDDALIFAARRVLTPKEEYPSGRGHVTAEQERKAIDFEKNWTVKYDRLDLGEDFIHFLKSDGQSLVKSQSVTPELRTTFLKKFNNKDGGISFYKVKFKKRSLRIVQTPFNYKGESKYVLQTGTSQKPVIDLLENRQVIFFVSIPVILVLASFIGRFLADKILNPVVEITTTAKNITYEDLSQRIKDKDVDEEMRSLVEAFNNMIARLETSFKHIAEFSSQVAHELKTPIAIMRGEIELALRKDRSNEEYKRVLKVSLGEAKRLLKTVEDLLLLAKLDYRPEIFKFENFNANKFFEEICEQTKVLASEKDIQVNMTLPKGKVIVKGNKLHLRRLFYNIIHNAMKFTPKGGQIDIAVKIIDGKLTTNISDTGVGIPKEDLPRVFDRFFHIEKPDQNSEPGNGLGLNIALSIAQIHQGRIDVDSRVNKGTVFTVTLPLS